MSATFWFWLSFLEAGDILLKLLRADHAADFEMHLDQVCQVHTSVYLSEMRGLENNEPERSAHMQKVGFVVRRSDKNFNSVPTDQNINREAKSKGGVIGYTLRKGALFRWLLTRHVIGEYAERFNDICSWAKSKKLHEELGDLG